MTVLNLEQIRSIVDFGLSGPRLHSSIRLAAAVADASGNVLNITREAGAPPLLADLAECKVRTCIITGKSTRSIMGEAVEDPDWFGSESRVAQSRFGLPLFGALGGVLMRDHDGKIIGAVAIAGDSGKGDERHAKLAIENAGFIADADGPEDLF